MIIKSEEFATYVDKLKIEILNKHISRPILVSKSSLFFHLSSSDIHRFVICFDSNCPRAYTQKDEINISSLDSSFYSIIRKDLANAYIENVEQYSNDRILKLTLIIINKVFKEEKRILYFEMIPSHSNLILTDENNNIIAFTHGSSLDSNRPILKGVKYFAPTLPFVKEQPTNFDYENYLNFCLKKENDIFLSRKKEKFGSLIKELSNVEKKLNKKIIFIEKDISTASLHLNDNEIGDYIYTNIDNLRSGSSLYINDKEIKLDENKSIEQSANSFYIKAKKAKKAIKALNEQKTKTVDDLNNIRSALLLIKNSDESGLESLSKQFGLTNNKKKELDFGNANIPYSFEKNGTTFLFGKNAKQNDTLTFLIDTCKNHLWFHILGYEGAHVMIKKDNPTNEEILTASEIALLSKQKDDGDVMVSKRKNVFKGSAPGQAIVREYNTNHLKNIRNETKILYQNAKKMKL